MPFFLRNIDTPPLLTLIFFLLFSSFENFAVRAQTHETNAPALLRPVQYVITLAPVNGGKAYHVYRNAKIVANLNNGVLISGKVRAISKDSISLDYKNYAISSITNFKFNPGNALGVAAAIGAVIGLAAIAFTASSKDNQRSSAEDAIFYSGIGLTAVSVALLIPNYFIKKNFPRTKYEYIPVALNM
ncbi:MAG: hypothetical protein H0W62_13245 [Chitinophagales bacterium]|nr:hypothetical protein [Chitinophagales bacterium]